ncbi:MAG TPA: histidine phosphatase family protein, partial [Bauldia sp.]|nr:histidine phosphatase family protein [Bauldia sp.]
MNVLSLYLLRHGETDFSHQGRFCGRIDAALTDEGREMAARFAASYGDLPWRAIVTSTRRRTIETATPLASRAALDIRRDPRLDEMFYGEWQGLSKSEAAAGDEAYFARWLEDPTIGPPLGESPHEVGERAIDAIDDLCSRYPSGNVLVVSHKALLRILVCRLFGKDLRNYRREPNWAVGAVSRIDIEAGEPTLRLYADVSHLEPELDIDRDALGPLVPSERRAVKPAAGG